MDIIAIIIVLGLIIGGKLLGMYLISELFNMK